MKTNPETVRAGNQDEITAGLLRKQELRVNKVTGASLLVFLLIDIAAGVLSLLGVFELSVTGSIVLMAAGLVATVPPLILGVASRWENRQLKYAIIFGLSLNQLLAGMLASYVMGIFLVIPILLTVLYCNPKLTNRITLIYAGLMTVIMAAGALWGAPDLNMVDIPEGTVFIMDLENLEDVIVSLGIDRIGLMENYFIFLWPFYMATIAMTWLITHYATKIFQRLLVDQDGIARKAATVQADLNTATNIQLDALPKVFPPYEHHPEIGLYANMNAAREVGGDFYDCFEIDDRNVCFLIADVSGKGVPAALFMMTAKTMIKDYARMLKDPAAGGPAVTAGLCSANEAGMFATAWIGILDTETGILRYTNAGHNWPLFARKGESYRWLNERHGFFLAGMETTKYRQGELRLEKGDSLFLYTDGVTEAHNAADELFGEDRLMKVLNAQTDRDGRSVLPAVKQEIDRFAGAREQFDDITMLMVNY